MDIFINKSALFSELVMYIGLDKMTVLGNY